MKKLQQQQKKKGDEIKWLLCSHLTKHLIELENSRNENILS
jgi:hypothetical protein